MSKRPDLAAMLAPLLREMIAAEQPVLDAHGLSMWGYVVLLTLDRSSVRTQAALADAIGADKTRIIRTLDDLQQQGFIEREADPDDRAGAGCWPSPMRVVRSRMRSSGTSSAGRSGWLGETDCR